MPRGIIGHERFKVETRNFPECFYPRLSGDIFSPLPPSLHTFYINLHGSACLARVGELCVQLFPPGFRNSKFPSNVVGLLLFFLRARAKTDA